MRKYLFPALISALLTATLALAGTGNLPQIVTQIIQKAHVNDIRSALSGDLVPRDSTGVVNDNADNLGQLAHRWASVDATQFCIVFSSGGNSICFSAASAPGSSQAITFPASLPGSTLPVQMSSGGVLSYATIAGAQVSSSINLPGNSVQENGNNLVVSAANAATSLAIVRGSLNSSGTSPLAGEGFTITHTNGSGLYTVNYSVTFASTPSITATCFDLGTFGCTVNIIAKSTSSVQFAVGFSDLSGTAVADRDIDFIAIGPR